MTSEIQFEKALARLEKIVEDLETGNIPLEEALKKYEEGVKLSRACQDKLAQAEKKIEVLTRTLNGSLKKEPFVLEDEDGEPQGRAAAPKKNSKNPPPKTAQDRESKDEEDLLF